MKYVCTVCDYVYDPAVGDPDNGIEPGTAFADLPDDWVCPECGVDKDEFEPARGLRAGPRTAAFRGSGTARGSGVRRGSEPPEPAGFNPSANAMSSRASALR